jgi:hypothetical protein
MAPAARAAAIAAAGQTVAEVAREPAGKAADWHNALI